MKAITAVCATGASVPAIINGRISRHRDGENAEIQMYLSKLKDLVPFMPKNRKLSKLEIIQHVIDYICDLQSELETHPAVNSFDAAAALNGQNQQQSQHNNSNVEQMSNGRRNSTPSSRQPLCVRPSPNTILSTSHNNPLSSAAISGESNHLTNSSHSHTTTDKRNQDRSSC